MLHIPTPSNILSRSFLVLSYVAFPVMLILYFLPTVVARRRGTRNDGGIILLNLFFGWTLLGWLVALVWAVTGTAVSRQT